MASVVVVGAGPAGATAARVLARAGMAVSLVHAGAPATFPVGEGLPPAVRPLLESLDLRASVDAQGHRPAFGNQSAWGGTALVATDFIAHPFGPGWHLDRRAFDAGLLDAARAAGAALVTARVRDVRGRAGAWQLQLEGPGGLTTLPAHIVIDCTGRRAAVARRLGARRHRHDRLVACAALLAPDDADVDATTLVESARDGWWYTARLPDATRIVMFMTDGDLLGGRAARTSAAFAAALAGTRHVGKRCAVDRRPLVIAPWVVAADTGRLDVAAGAGWFAAGDAALSFDPVSSQGIMTAMRAGQLAAQAALDSNTTTYVAAIDAMFARYLRAHADVYAQEQRWRDAPFWRRRHDAAASAKGVRGVPG